MFLSFTSCQERCYLGDDVFELALLPGVCGVVHHGDDGIVVLLVLVVEEHKLSPQVSLLRCPENLEHSLPLSGALREAELG